MDFVSSLYFDIFKRWVFHLYVEKQQIAKEVESNANIVGGVCAKDGDADGEKGGMVEGDQAVHNHLQGVVILVGIGRRLRIFFL